MNINYEHLMRRVLRLASKGWGRTMPNPMVGAILVKDGRVISEGFHEGPGKPHAEVNAIDNSQVEPSESELIINLEPCCHHGKTGPCTEKIISSGIKRVTYGMIDPNPEVAGKGVKQLKSAGVEIEGPFMEKECSQVNRFFINWVKRKRPFVIAKAAISLDGKIASQSGDSKWISSEATRKRMHYWRSGVDAVLVGGVTARTDNPLLDARLTDAVKQPRPVVLSQKGDLPHSLSLWNRKPAPIIFTFFPKKFESINNSDAEIIPLPSDKEYENWQYILRELGKRNIYTLLAEGGSSIHAQMIKYRLANYIIASISPKLIGREGREWLPSLDIKNIKEAIAIEPDQVLTIDNDIVVEGEIAYQEE